MKSKISLTIGMSLWLLSVIMSFAWLEIKKSGASETPMIDLVSLQNMESTRAAHSSSKIGEGRILIAGGMSQATLADAIVYNYADDVLEKIGPMIERRQSHTADVLSNGEVILTGGYNDDWKVTSSIEIFSPLTNSFSKIGDLLQERSGHLSAVISDEEILFVGGIGNNWNYLRSAEIFNFRTRKSRMVGSMSDPREGHILQSLGGDKYLVSGGHSGRREHVTIYSSAEIFDVKTERFRKVTPMTTRRHKHDSIQLEDGKILILGGADERDGRGAYKSVEIFNPKTESFSHYGEMNYGRYKHEQGTINLGEGLFLLTGGSPKMELLDSRLGRFIQVDHDQTLSGLFSSAVSLGNHEVLISGGYGYESTFVDKMFKARLKAEK